MNHPVIPVLQLAKVRAVSLRDFPTASRMQGKARAGCGGSCTHRTAASVWSAASYFAISTARSTARGAHTTLTIGAVREPMLGLRVRQCAAGLDFTFSPARRAS